MSPLFVTQPFVVSSLSCRKTAKEDTVSGRPRKNRLEASAAEREALKRICQDSALHPRKRLGAQILLYALDGLTTAEIAVRTGVSQSFAASLVRRAPLLGLTEAVEAMPLCWHQPKITAAGAEWICSLARKRPAELGITAMPEWSMESLAGYIRSYCEMAGYPELRKVVKSTVWRILRSERQGASHESSAQQAQKSPAESGA